jgi:hypothetical protein
VRRGAPSHAAVGKAVLIRAIRQGTTLERRLAIELAPLPDRAVLSSLDEAAKSEDLELRVLALTRLGDAPERREHARAALKKLAVKTGNSALQAQRALADFGDSSIAPKLAQQLRARHPAERREGALALVQLGDWSRAAPALADDDPDVRTAVACRVLAAR